MAAVANKYLDELIYEPNLTVPKEKPVGEVKVNREASRSYLFRDEGATGTVANQILDDSHNLDYLTAASVSKIIDRYGPHINRPAAASIYQDNPKSVHSGQITIFAVARFVSAGINQQIIAADSSTTGERDFQFRWTTGNVLQFIPFVGGTSYTLTGSTAKNTTDIYAVAARYDGETSEIFLNGISDGSDTTPSGALDADNPRLGIGSRMTSTSATTQAEAGGEQDWYLVQIFDEALTDGEIWDMSNNWYKYYSPASQAIFPVTAAGGRIMSSLAGYGGLAGHGGLAGKGGGLAG